LIFNSIKKYNDYITIIIMYDQSIPFTAYALIGVTTLIVTYSNLISKSDNGEEVSNQEDQENDVNSVTPDDQYEQEDKKEYNTVNNVQTAVSNPNISSNDISNVNNNEQLVGGKKKRKTRNRKKKNRKSKRKMKSITKRKYLLF
tara:strand:- start:3750 stop:4181 length:432 start_codon:yes stop_codon:yes gene_type:complete